MKIDAMGQVCPIPVVKAKKALDQAEAGTIIEIHVDNEIAVANLEKMASSQGCSFSGTKVNDTHYVVNIEKGMVSEKTSEQLAAESDSGAVNQDEAENRQLDEAGMGHGHKQIVVIASAYMGTGDERLGKTLMKGFLFALSQLEDLPKKILFYNSGVTLTTEGSESIEDLKAMEEQGVEIVSCGTCLDFYGLTSKLQVGAVTNMYAIVQAMAQADQILRP